ncbi:hypothetical protein [Foetidibacter luteolus]|uniref:hypothetical protein n=1 Tax=Foetidibacter luteolus TaxID=2608880 RepID=UPI00129BC88E|nr:hypothetical protein [Foetidibacter luteolus]
MRNISLIRITACILIVFGLLFFGGCKKRDITGLRDVAYPTTGEVFIDDFTGDLAYSAFGGSDVKAFQVDKQETYASSSASMRFAVPDANSPQGSYAGGVFYSKTGRNLSGYNALSFYIKATQAATIGSIGFGNDLGESKYLVTLNAVAVNSNWKKVIIPIPDASKLTAEKGLMYYSAGPENDRGYTFWIDEVKFEKIADLAHLTGIIFNGQNNTIAKAETGDKITINGLMATVNLPSGINETVNISPYYFTFLSSSTGVAGVAENGLISIVDAGTATITAKLGSETAAGSLSITSTGAPIMPAEAAPAPTRDAANVISLYSNAYTNVPVDTWNTHWQFSTTENFFVTVSGDDIIRYRSLNFVGIEFKNPPVNASSMQVFHIDMWTPDATEAPNNFKILLVDFGANGVFGGGDDSQHEIEVTSPVLATKKWVGIDIPLSSFTGLTNKAHLAQLVLSGSVPNVYLDNVYFYKNPTNPPTGAPVPSTPAENVLSVFSDSYTNISGTDFNPNWGQSTVVTQTPVGGNNALYYAAFNYQGVQLGSSQDVSSYAYLHLDYYSANASQLRIFLISPGPVETPYTLNVPTSGWNSVDIPLSAFSPVALNSIIQLKFDGGTGVDVYLDNIYFWKIPPVPPVAAPTPAYPAADVISIFSDAYTNVAGSDFNPNWGQATVTTQTPVAGNNTLLYSGLNYQGLQLGSNQDVSGKTYLHIDYYTANSTSLKVFLISPGPVETSYTLGVPTTNGWNSVDIPLTAFAPVALNSIFQFKFEGNGNIYIDNILFR